MVATEKWKSMKLFSGFAGATKMPLNGYSDAILLHYAFTLSILQRISLLPKKSPKTSSVTSGTNAMNYILILR